MERPVSILTQEKEAYLGILELTRQQNALVEAGDIEALEQLVEKKQKYIDLIELLEKEACSLENRDVGNPDTEALLLLGDIRDIIHCTITVQDGLDAVYEERRTQSRVEMGEVEKKRKAVHGYKPFIEVKPRFMDKIK